MLRNLVAFSARNKVLVLLLGLAGVIGGIEALRRIPLDALPDVSDVQVILLARWNRPPNVIEDQVSYPLVTAMLGTAQVKTVRASTDFGYSYVYVLFKEGTELYWARSRVIESLSKILPQLPSGVRISLGPDATSIGWIYQYALVDRTGRRSLADLRTLQDWSLKYQLESVDGVAEVAPIGGFQKEYQVSLNPNALWSYGIPASKAFQAVADNNNETGARVIEMSGREFMLRPRGYLKGVKDLKEIAVGHDPKRGVPILLGDVAHVAEGPALRRGVGEFNGLGEAPGGVVIMRQGENAYDVIARVKEKLKSIKPFLPPGVEIIQVYDRSALISRAMGTLKEALAEEIAIVAIVVLFFLWHPPSAAVPIVTLPAAVFMAFIPMLFLKIGANIMSLSGLAISIGILVDGAVVEAENAHKRLEAWQEGGSRGDPSAICLHAIQEVAPAVFFSLLVVAVSFLPIFALSGESGRLFRPLAATKTLVMAAAALLAVTLDPVLRLVLMRFKTAYHPESGHPVSRRLHALYAPAARLVLKHPRSTVLAALLAILATIPVLWKLGSEFLPPMEEGTILYMPTGLPGISADEAGRVLQIQDRILKSFPEVETVYGKAGRADTATDPAPLSMFETLVQLKSKKDWPQIERGWFGRRRRTYRELLGAMDRALQIPGFPNIWTQPIHNRIEMLATGLRTPVGVKVFGPDLASIQKAATAIEGVLNKLPGTGQATAERPALGYYADFEPDRKALARYGLSIKDLDAAIGASLGGEEATEVIAGRARFGVTMRYAYDFRDDVEKFNRVLVGTPEGRQIPLGALGRWRLDVGPAMIRDENGMLSAYVYADLKTGNIGGYVAKAREALARALKVPPGVSYEFSGEYRRMEEDRQRLKLVVPLALFIILLLLYANTGSWTEAGIVLLAVPFSAVGAVWLLLALGYHLSVAVWVGLIALLGLDAETGIFMLLYLDLALKARREAGRINNDEDLREAVFEGAVLRLRPKLMTVACAFMGLLPVMFSRATGADIMKRIAAPMVGGLATSFLLELLVYPAVYYLWKRRELPSFPAAGK
jgi:Cu(I)/Ag(I) efflux system membrane protein CusA/SilA